MNPIAAATRSGLFLATIYNQSQLAERKHMACYWSINTAVMACSINRTPLLITSIEEFMSDTTQRLCTNHTVRFRSFLVYILYGFL